jgi:predicted nucleic acid-binding protein
MIFADSSYFIGLADLKDQWHPLAVRVLKKVKENLIISDLVISETVTSIGSRAGGKAGKRIYNYFCDNCEIVFVDDDLLEEGMEIFLRYDGKLSVADSVSIAIMKRRAVKKIISFDSDFDRVKGINRIY